jgi:hypothetical protein
MPKYILPYDTICLGVEELGNWKIDTQSLFDREWNRKQMCLILCEIEFVHGLNCVYNCICQVSTLATIPFGIEGHVTFDNIILPSALP